VPVAPVLLGAGIPLHAGSARDRIELEPVSLDRSGEITSLRFRVRK
jgi:hypothetical protein